MAQLATELTVATVLGDDGVIGEYIPDFVPRASQLGMAELISEAISLGESRVIEASTGIGFGSVRGPGAAEVSQLWAPAGRCMGELLQEVRPAGPVVGAARPLGVPCPRG